MPIEVDLPDGSVAEFPDGTSKDVMKAAISKRFPPSGAKSDAPPQVPFYADDGKGGQVNAYDSPEELAKLDATHQATVNEQAALEASRTPGKRLGDTAAFVASLPVRMATRGEYGAGDLARAVAPGAGKAMNQAEGDFVGANTGKSALETWDPRDIPTLATMQHVGEIAPGVPEFGSMGAVRGQVLRQGAGELRRFLRNKEGSGPVAPPMNDAAPPAAAGGGIYGQSSGPDISKGPFVQPGSAGGAPPGSPPPPSGPIPPGAPPPQAPIASRMPNRDETFAASDRLKQNLGVNVDIPEMVANERQQRWAAGLRSFPIAGDPIDAMYTKGLGQLEVATKTAGDTLGTPVGREAAGEGLKQGTFAWMGKNSKDYLASKYDEVYSKIDPAATRPLAAASKLTDDLAAEMKESTGTAAKPVIDKLKAAVERPGGLSVKGQAQLRSEVGDMLDESVINKSPNQRALKRAYGALTDDLKATIKQAGGTKALEAWEVANKEARTVAIKNKRLAKIVGTDENKLSGGDVFNKAVAIGQEKAGNSRAINALMDVVGEKQRGNFAAQMLDHMGMNPKTELYSADRFISEYNKMSSYAKQRYFGAAKPHLDDITDIAKKYSQLGSKFNHSNTGTVNAVLKVLGNPAGIAANVVTAGINPLSAFTLAGQGVALGVGRRMAWSLARPSSAAKTASVLRSYYGVAKAAGKGAEFVAAKEETLSKAIRSFSLSVARETGGNAKTIEADLAGKIKDIRNGQANGAAAPNAPSAPGKTVSPDELEAEIVRQLGPRKSFDIPSIRKAFPDVSDEEFSKALDEMARRGVIGLPKKK